MISLIAIPPLCLLWWAVESISLQVGAHPLRPDCEAAYLIVDFGNHLGAQPQNNVQMEQDVASEGESFVWVLGFRMGRDFPRHCRS